MAAASLSGTAAEPGLSGLVSRLEPDLIALRRDLHRHPELSLREVRTAGVVARWLQDLGLAVRTGVGGTGVLADLVGARPGPTLLLRADMDALPITEADHVEFASESEGVMHACGHDAHTASLLGAATVLSRLRRQIRGRVRFCFQPAEEILGGALRMIEDGAMEGVDHVLGAHVDAFLPFGTVAAAPGAFLAGADFFEIVIRGGAGHAATPHLSVDPLYVACQVVIAAQSIVSRETRAGEPLVLSIGGIEGGTVANILVDEVILRGTLRWFSSAERERALERLEALSTAVCSGLRAGCEFRLTARTPVTSNDPTELGLLTRVVAESGRASLVDPGRMMVSDDVARLLERVPGVYFLAGARPAAPAPHHHPRFDIDERVIGLICELLVRSALQQLR